MARRLVLRLVVGLAFGVSVVIFSILHGAAPTTGTVPRSLFVSTGGAGDCSQFQPCDLQTALAQASDGDSIFFASGTYTGTGGSVITLTKSIGLYGGWNGSVAMPPVRDAGAHPTRLDGEGHRRVVGVESGITATLDGLIVSNGTVIDNGAGIYAKDAYLTISNTTVYSNVAVNSSSLNTCGGGAYVEGGSLQVVSSTFQSNVAFNGPGPSGGGLYVSGTLTTTIDDSIFMDNRSWLGSGIWLGYGPGLIRRSHFGEGYAGYGGGIELEQAVAQVEDSTFIGARAGNNGGALHAVDSAVVLDRNIIRDNSAYVAPGVEFLGTSSYTLTDNIIAHNQPGGNWAGGIWAGSSGPGLLLNNTIAQNVGNKGGYGLYVVGSGPIDMVNNILVSHTVGVSVTLWNTAVLTATLWGSGAWANGTDWGGAGTVTTGTVNIWGDPDFRNPTAGDYHIGPKSAAINAGVDDGVSDDIDGEHRMDVPDIGADECILYAYLPIIMQSY